MSKHWRVVKNIVEVQEGAVSENEDCYGTFKKLVRNSEYSKSDNFKKLSVLAQLLSFLDKENTCKSKYQIKR